MADAQAGQSQQQQRPPQRHAPSYSSGSGSGSGGGSGSGSGSGSRGGNNEQSADSADLTQSSPPKATRPSQLRRKSTDKVHSATTARLKGQKHVVGGGASTARLHARVPSSKALHKLHAPSAKLQEQTLLQLQQLQQLQQQQQQRQRRRFSPSPPTAPSDFADRFPFAAAPPPDEPSPAQSHRKHQHHHSASSTDTKLLLRSLENSVSTSSLMRRNASASSLKRNRSHADVAKRMSHPPARPSANLKRATTSQGSGSDRLRQASSTTAAKKPAGQVRFEIGSVDAQEDEWVDAGPATASGSQTSSFRHEETKAAEAKTPPPQPLTAQTQPPQLTQIELPIRSAYAAPAHSRNKLASPPPPPPPLLPSQPDTEDDTAGEPQHPPLSPSMTHSILRSASTTKLLPRTPPRGAPPKMSHETAVASANASHVVTSSPDSSPTRQMLHKQSDTAGSSDRDAMTSRFITSGSHGSGSAGATTGESYYTASSSRSNPGRREGAIPSHRLSTSIGATALSPYHRTQGEGGADTSFLTDDEETGVFIARIHPRREGAPPAERSRTQQKLNLERASSSIDRSSHQHQGPAAGPLLGGGENGMQDPRIGKLMEKTGMGYYVVRRYQNPVTRSLSRLTDRLGGDRNWRVPAVSLSRTTTGLSGDTADGSAAGSNRPGSRDSTAGRAAAPVPSSPAASSASASASAAGAPGLSQSFRERDIRRDVLQSAAAAMASAAGLAAGVVPHSQARAVGAADSVASAAAAGEPGAQYEQQQQQQQQRLGSSSPDDGNGADSTSSLLRMLWEKNLYLGTSQD